jgi:hypothetical protein
VSEHDRDFPLSGPQEHMWEYLRFLNPADPGETFMNQVSAIRLAGDLDLAALRASVDAVVRRHDALRITLDGIGVRPRQRVNDDVHVPVTVVDLSGMSPGERDRATAERIMREDIAHLDLIGGPLVRVQLIRFAPDEHVLLATFNHLITDAWSAGVFFKDLELSYQSAVTGRSPRRPPLGSEYRDFALRVDPAQAAKVDYWRRRLADAPPLLDLPADRPRADVDACEYGFHPFTLEPPIPAQMAALARRRRVSLFILYLTAYNAMLFRRSGQADLIVGTIMAQRNDPAAMAIVGLFSEILFLRNRLDGRQTFAETLESVRRNTLEDYRNCISFGSIAPVAHPGFEAERPWPPMNLYHAWFQLDAPTPTGGTMHALRTQPFEYDISEAPCHTFRAGSPQRRRAFMAENPTFELSANGAGGLVQYNKHLFDRSTITRMVADFGHILRAVLADNDARIDSLPVSG